MLSKRKYKLLVALISKYPLFITSGSPKKIAYINTLFRLKNVFSEDAESKKSPL